MKRQTEIMNDLDKLDIFNKGGSHPKVKQAIRNLRVLLVQEVYSLKESK